MKLKNDPQQVFVAPKVHGRVRNIRLIIEILLLVVVIIGTAFSLFASSDFSLAAGVEKLKTVVSLKKQSSPAGKLSAEERVRALIDKKLLNITSLEGSGAGFTTIRSLEGVTVIISNQKDLENQARALQTLLSKAKIEGKVVDLVDFRFDKIVVHYK